MLTDTPLCVAEKRAPIVVFTTKYALTGGIAEKRVAKHYSYDSRAHVYVEGDTWTSYLLGRDAFDNLPDALANAEARRLKKIASLQKQIAKLEKLNFIATLARAGDA